MEVPFLQNISTVFTVVLYRRKITEHFFHEDTSESQYQHA